MKKVVITIFLLLSLSICFAQDINIKFEMDIAKHYKRYGYTDKAKECLIRVYHCQKSPKEIKSEALYLLGQISYEDGDFVNSLEEWEQLINEFPESKETKIIDKRLPDIRKTINKATEDQLSALEIASDFHRHNFSDRAKEKFLNIYHDPHASEDDKAEALYLIGQISFEEGDFTIALEDWEILITRYPKSKQTLEIANRLPQLREIITQDSDTSIISVVAKSYIKNGDFWSNAKNTFNIDYSWMPNVELSIQWYDRTIKEFPNTNAAEIAYRRKLFALLGWKESGRDGEKYGAMKSHKQYINEIIDTFTNFSKEYPRSQFLQGFRYQIAQTFWFNKDWENAKIWLQKVINASNGQITFYTETAKSRLDKLQY